MKTSLVVGIWKLNGTWVSDVPEEVYAHLLYLGLPHPLPAWYNTLAIHVKHQRLNIIRPRGAETVGYIRRCLFLDTDEVGEVESRCQVGIVTTSRLKVGLIGSSPTTSIGLSRAYGDIPSLEHAYLQCLSMLAHCSIKGWFSKSTLVKIPRLVNPEELLKWKEDPRYFEF